MKTSPHQPICHTGHPGLFSVDVTKEPHVSKNFELVRLYLRNEVGTAIAGIIASTCGRTMLADTVWFADSQVCDKYGHSLLDILEQEAAKNGCTTVYIDQQDRHADALCLSHGYFWTVDLSNIIGPIKPWMLRKTFDA